MIWFRRQNLNRHDKIDFKQQPKSRNPVEVAEIHQEYGDLINKMDEKDQKSIKPTSFF